MAYMRLPPNTGMGQGIASVIASAIGPLAKAGTEAYATHEETKLSEKELEQREVEFKQAMDLAQRQLAAQERQKVISEHAKLQRAAARSYWLSANLPYIVGALGLVAVAAIAFSAKRRRS